MVPYFHDSRRMRCDSWDASPSNLLIPSCSQWINGLNERRQTCEAATTSQCHFPESIKSQTTGKMALPSSTPNVLPGRFRKSHWISTSSSEVWGGILEVVMIAFDLFLGGGLSHQFRYDGGVKSRGIAFWLIIYLLKDCILVRIDELERITRSTALAR